jgi:FkbM family methyltransferase
MSIIIENEVPCGTNAAAGTAAGAAAGAAVASGPEGTHRVFYGSGVTMVDVTARALTNVRGADTATTAALVHIPRGDSARATLFGIDPTPGVLKTVVVYDDGAFAEGMVVCAHSQAWVQVGASGDGGGGSGAGSNDGSWHVVLSPARVPGPPIHQLRDAKVAATVLAAIHAGLDMQNLTNTAATTAQIMAEELPEQMLIARAVHPCARVLEIGGNIGRSTCVIASLLDDSSKLVVLESDPVSVASLYRNRVVNKLQYHVEAAALSERPLMQRGWNTADVPAGGVLPAGWTPVHTITYAQLCDRYGPGFYDTVVADCEGALTAICRDTPAFFRGVHTVVLENDFTNPGDKEVVDAAMRAAGLQVAVTQAGGWGLHAAEFFQVWMRA